MTKPSLLERLKRKKKQLVMPVIGVSWYTAEDWERVKARATDPDRFEATFQEWTAMAEVGLGDLKRAGVNPVKVMIDADEFSAWCSLHRKQNNAASRAEFVTEKVRAQHPVRSPSGMTPGG